MILRQLIQDVSGGGGHRLADEAAKELDRFVALALAVRQMRALQREYFRTRHHEKLQQSKQAEREVDRLLAELDAPAPKQGGLFE